MRTGTKITRTPRLSMIKYFAGSPVFNVIINPRGAATNLAESHPDIVEELTAQMQEYDAEITANAREPWIQSE